MSRGPLYIGVGAGGVPVIVERDPRDVFPDAREATDEEYAAYVAYWRGPCDEHDGAHERGDCPGCAR